MCVVGVVVWVLGVLSGVAGCLCGLVGVVASGGVGVGFDVGFSSVPVSGSAPVGFSSVHVSGSGSVSAPVGFSSVHVSGSGSVSAPSSVVSECGGVRVCSVGVCGVWCFVVFFGGGLLVWVGAAGVGGGCWSGFGYVRFVVSGGVVSSRGGVVSSGLLFSRLRLFMVVLCLCVRLLVVGVVGVGFGVCA